MFLKCFRPTPLIVPLRGTRALAKIPSPHPFLFARPQMARGGEKRKKEKKKWAMK